MSAEIRDDGTFNCPVLHSMDELETVTTEAWRICLSRDPDDERRPRVVGCKLTPDHTHFVLGIDVLGARLTVAMPVGALTPILH